MTASGDGKKPKAKAKRSRKTPVAGTPAESGPRTEPSEATESSSEARTDAATSSEAGAATSSETGATTSSDARTDEIGRASCRERVFVGV